jgi:hypothetical protein
MIFASPFFGTTEAMWEFSRRVSRCGDGFICATGSQNRRGEENGAAKQIYFDPDIFDIFKQTIAKFAIGLGRLLPRVFENSIFQLARRDTETKLSRA